MSKKMHPSLDEARRVDKLEYVCKMTPEVMSYTGIGRRHHEVKFRDIIKFPSFDLLDRFNRRIYSAYSNGWGLILYGKNSIGKTCAAVALTKHALATGASCLFIESSMYTNSLLEKKMFEGNQTVLDRARTVDLLVLDDFGKQSVDIKKGTWGQRVFEELMRLRSKNMLSTIITTNWNPTKWGEWMGPSFSEVIKETMVVIHMTGEDRRIDNVRGS